MTNENELHDLIMRMRIAGANVEYTMDCIEYVTTGRKIIADVKITNVQGIGPNRMQPIAAAEVMRKALAEGVSLR